MSNTVLTKLSNKELKIKSNELVEIINEFRMMESEARISQDENAKPKAMLQHKDFIKKIETELETLKSLDLEGERNFSPSSYIDSQNKKQKCYELNRDGMIQMLNSESALVRFKTTEYINQLEDTIKQVDITVKTKGRLTESEWNKIQKKSIYLNEEIHDRKSLRKFIREYDPMKLDECIDTIAEMTNKMKGSIKHELLDVAIKELKVIDSGLMKDNIKNTYIKDTCTEGIIVLQDVKIGKYKRKLSNLI